MVVPDLVVLPEVGASVSTAGRNPISPDRNGISPGRNLVAPGLEEIGDLDRELEDRYSDRLVLQPALSRPLVSFQANKTRPVYRWYKYKEAFSASLVEYLFEKYKITQGRFLDPFAGSGTALFVASASGMMPEGIELLPIGQQLIAAKQLLETEFTTQDFADLARWSAERPWEATEEQLDLPELRITRGAYPAATHAAIGKYLAACRHENDRLQVVLRFALLCVLESISFTRKDGQYLRWDHRSGRHQGSKPFDKGAILDFAQAVSTKINEMLADLHIEEHGQLGRKYPPGRILPPGLFPIEAQRGDIHLYHGSCLDVMPTLAAGAYDAVMTSPPYCNRYDYTRTYALELALLNTDERALSELRQQMLSCTVENRAKDLLKINPGWKSAVAAADGQELLQAILSYLENQKIQGKLNNNGIPRMVRGYFYEMACIIAECARVLKPDAPLLMVNDNVRYAGASVSVDLLLSNIAEHLGFDVESILVLPNGKGNSSQQMDKHGRDPLRKCVYVWRKRGIGRAMVV